MKNYLTPILIILFTGLLGAVLFLGQKVAQVENNNNTSAPQKPRLLTFRAPGMFCIGCSASVEAYLSSVEGVQNVSASLGTKRVEVIYDGSVVDKDTILANQILDAYGKESITDEKYTGTGQEQTISTTNLPQSLALKLQEAAAKISKLENQEQYQETFNQIDKAIAQENYQKAENLLDNLLKDLGGEN